jgi:hypothetical protein
MISMLCWLVVAITANGIFVRRLIPFILPLLLLRLLGFRR